MKMNFGLNRVRSRMKKSAVLIAGGFFMFGFLQTCNDRFVNLTRFIDPCGTVFANCTPGFFETNAADIGDFCVDPSCTVPGGCNNDQPLGTITNVCP